MNDLTPRRRQTYRFILSFLERHGFPPSVREVASHLGITTKGAFDHLRALERQGYIGRGSRRSRAITITRRQEEEPEIVEIPVLGTVVAGQPLLAEANLDGTYPLTRSGIGAGESFALRVRGDSMIDALIDDGDIVILEPAQSCDDGEIVAVWLREENETTLKKFYHEGDRIRLQPRNPAMAPIYASPANVEVQGRFLSAISLA